MSCSYFGLEEKKKLSVALSEDILVGFFSFWVKHANDFGFFMFLMAFGLLCKLVVERILFI